MRKTILILLICISSLYAAAQNRYPEFYTEAVVLRVPTTIPGIMKDSVRRSGDTVIYNLRGQILDTDAGNTIQLVSDGYSGTSKQKTPWQTLTDLMAAYAEKDFDKALSYYSKATRDEVIAAITDREAFLNFMSNVKRVKVVMGFEYKKGWIGIVDVDGQGVSAMYFEKKGSKWFLAALKENGPVVWNISLYWKFRPGPLSTPVFVQGTDSMTREESMKFTFRIPTEGQWLVIFKNVEGASVLFSVQDGSPADLDPLPGQVAFTMRGNKMLSPGKFTLHAVASSYPITKVQKSMVTKALAFTFKITS